MLIDKLVKTGEVYSFKMSSGEEIIAKVTGVDSAAGTIEIHEPLSLAPSQGGPTLVPSMFTAEQDKNITLNTNTVSLFAVTADSIRIKYTEMITGITTPSKKIVLG
jgi:hypothetical protein